MWSRFSWFMKVIFYNLECRSTMASCVPGTSWWLERQEPKSGKLLRHWWTNKQDQNVMFGLLGAFFGRLLHWVWFLFILNWEIWFIFICFRWNTISRDKEKGHRYPCHEGTASPTNTVHIRRPVPTYARMLDDRTGWKTNPIGGPANTSTAQSR